MNNFSILIGASPSKFFHLNEFSTSLQKLGINCKVVIDSEISDGFPSRRIRNWFSSSKKFETTIQNFKPDLILVDRQRHFGQNALKTKIPVIVHLRGDFWAEINWAKQTIYKSFPKNIAINQWEKIGKYCFQNADMIMPICKYLENKVNKQVPKIKTAVMYQGIDPNNWFKTQGMKLKHPCVGILQSANIWGKVKEMLILPKILELNPKITFYWVGDGPYRKQILETLRKYDNFVWLGQMDYPNQVRDFLSEIDLYALISGADMSPLTLLEAQLMNKPVLATKVGGIPELMINKKTGFLIGVGDHDEWNKKISLILNDNDSSKKMGKNGRTFVEENFNWEIISKRFLQDIQNNID